MEGYSKHIKVTRKRDGKILVPNCAVADNPWLRMKGLLGISQLKDEEALWIKPSTSIHTFFMKMTIDAAFIDKKGKIVAIYDSLKPWRFSSFHWSAHGVLETKAGFFRSKGIKEGEELELCPSI